MEHNAMTVLLELSPGSDRFDPESEAWAGQEQELFDDLRAGVGEVRRAPAATSNSKGALEAVLIALASAGAFNGAFDCMRAWLTRDRTRRLEISYERDGHVEKLTITGDRIGGAEFDQLTAWAARQLDGGS